MKVILRLNKDDQEIARMFCWDQVYRLKVVSLFPVWGGAGGQPRSYHNNNDRGDTQRLLFAFVHACVLAVLGSALVQRIRLGRPAWFVRVPFLGRGEREEEQD